MKKRGEDYLPFLKRENDMKKILLTVLLIIFTSACGNNEVTVSKVDLTDAKIKLYRQKVLKDPGNYGNYDNLAYYYLQKARETGNHDFFHLAEDAVVKSIEIKPDSYTGLVLYAKLKLAGHKFTEALKYTKKALEINPDSSYAYGIQGDAYLELHQISNAEKAYKIMLDINPSLDSFSRMSNLMRHKHNHILAIKYMELAYEAGLMKSSTPKENLAWTQVMLGEIYLDSGNREKAEFYFKNALGIYDGYYLAVNNLDKLEI